MTDLNTLLKLAQEMNLSEKDLGNLKNAESIAEKYKGKSEEEVLLEILKLKESMTKDKAAFARQLSLLKGMRPMLGKEQRQKFDQLIAIIEKW